MGLFFVLLSQSSLAGTALHKTHWKKKKLPHSYGTAASCLAFSQADQLDQLNDSHLSGVASTGADLDDAGVTAVGLLILGSNLIKQLLSYGLLGNVSIHLTLSVEVILLSDGDHLLCHRGNLFSTSNCGLYLTVLEKEGNHSSEHCCSVSCSSSELSCTGH